MPQASDALTDKFPGMDAQALAEIDNRFVVDKGFIIRPRAATGTYVATERENDAIDYLCDEWDFGYDATPAVNPPPPKWGMSQYEKWKADYDRAESLAFLVEEFPSLAAYAVAKER